MADITNSATPVHQDGECFKTALFSVKSANTGDTMDLTPYFKVIKRAGMVSATGTTIAGLAVSNSPNNLPVLLTVPGGVAADGIWVLVVGVAV